MLTGIAIYNIGGWHYKVNHNRPDATVYCKRDDTSDWFASSGNYRDIMKTVKEYKLKPIEEAQQCAKNKSELRYNRTRKPSLQK